MVIGKRERKVERSMGKGVVGRERGVSIFCYGVFLFLIS